LKLEKREQVFGDKEAAEPMRTKTYSFSLGRWSLASPKNVLNTWRQKPRQ
jgi:hypothetical protein